MGTLLSLPGLAVSRALRTTADSGPLSRVYYTTYRGRPVLVSSDSFHMIMIRLPGDAQTRNFSLSFQGAFRQAPTAGILKSRDSRVELGDNDARITWIISSPRRTVGLAANYHTTQEALEFSDSHIPDFGMLLRNAEVGQDQGFHHLMSPDTAKLIAGMDAGAARIFGSKQVTTPYCIRFEEDPSILILAMPVGDAKYVSRWSLP